jgi:hypothetical protein
MYVCHGLMADPLWSGRTEVIFGILEGFLSSLEV